VSIGWGEPQSEFMALDCAGFYTLRS